MNVRKSDEFIADVELTFEHYFQEAGLEVARQYRAAVENRCQLIAKNPQLGPKRPFKHPRLRGWRFFVLAAPFNKHLVFYEICNDELIMRRAMHGHRNLRKRLLESSQT